MTARSDSDRITALSAQAATVCQYERQLLAAYEQLSAMYAGYGGDAWANAVADNDYTTAGIEKAKLKTACAGTAITPLGSLRSDIYHIEES